MIDYQLKVCCDECNHLDLDYSQECINWYLMEPAYIRTTIRCRHQKVCGRYNEVTYTEVLNENETGKK